MKVCTITCHDVYNYGASLQAFALQEFCKLQGVDYEIINYKPPYLSQHFRLDRVSNPKYDMPVIRFLYILAKIPGRLYGLVRKQSFDNFTQKYLQLSGLRYDSFDALRLNPPQADVYLAGSDQIWNTLFPNGHDPAFYLQFVPKDKLRISYAASFATDKIYGDGAKGNVKRWLANFDRISVRESSAQELLRQLGYNESTYVCDPVFLLEPKIWNKHVNYFGDNFKKYLLVYDCDAGDSLKRLSLYIAKELNLKIVAVNNYKRYADVSLPNIGPFEFLSLVKGAQYIVANSFHATAFSLIFKKDFYIVHRAEKINSRMSDLLHQCDLDNRMLVGAALYPNLDKIDYGHVNKKLNPFIESSKKFLLETLKCQ